jgi:hypothetical protein
LLCECIGTLCPFLIVISMTRITSFSKITLADFGATLRMCLAKALSHVSSRDISGFSRTAPANGCLLFATRAIDGGAAVWDSLSPSVACSEFVLDYFSGADRNPHRNSSWASRASLRGSARDANSDGFASIQVIEMARPGFLAFGHICAGVRTFEGLSDWQGRRLLRTQVNKSGPSYDAGERRSEQKPAPLKHGPRRMASDDNNCVREHEFRIRVSSVSASELSSLLV